jgi:hypothetical protein
MGNTKLQCNRVAEGAMGKAIEYFLNQCEPGNVAGNRITINENNPQFSSVF